MGSGQQKASEESSGPACLPAIWRKLPIRALLPKGGERNGPASSGPPVRRKGLRTLSSASRMGAAQARASHPPCWETRFTNTLSCSATAFFSLLIRWEKQLRRAEATAPGLMLCLSCVTASSPIRNWNSGTSARSRARAQSRTGGGLPKQGDRPRQANSARSAAPHQPSATTRKPSLTSLTPKPFMSTANLSAPGTFSLCPLSLSTLA